jgi:hypothetical protein
LRAVCRQDHPAQRRRGVADQEGEQAGASDPVGEPDGHEVLDLLPQVYGERGSRPVPRVRLQQRGGEADPLLSRELLQRGRPNIRRATTPLLA